MENSIIVIDNPIIRNFDNEENISVLSSIEVNGVNIWVLESDESILVKGILPNVEQKDLKIDYKNGDIILNVTQRVTTESSGMGFVSFMSTCSSFTRVVTVGEVDIQNLKCEYINNKLSLYIPKFKIVEATYEEVE
ncbi:MAG: Hsp20/alpha crystallin family protein [Clostridium sp.]